ncbi:MAG: dihydroorotate dehydrogenase-like protein [candidate division KSB1 bacterium]|nr:dihydroorotate dehydrogenase-like protein [candidate division KSB1 bacterium]MDZ7346447.1 dihydroorotate dehydrogenase-like protein [candidate division KSB1 bacterium]
MDLSTTYMGLKLKNPLVPSASPLSKTLDGIKKLEDAGAAAVVLYSLFEEQIAFEQEELNYFLDRGTGSFAEALSYFPEVGEYNLGPEEYLEHIRRAKEATSIPIIASLNGVSAGGWIDYAKKMQEAGADALELNIYFLATDPNQEGRKIENQYRIILNAVKSNVTIPVAVKLHPFFSSLARMAKELDDDGADGLVLFNRFYQPDLDLENLEVVPGVVLSTSADLRLPLRWIAILYGKVKASLAGTTGVHTAMDALKMVAAGADVVQVCAALLKNGPAYLGTILKGMEKWLEEKEYDSLSTLKGSMSQKAVAEPAVFERANYMKALNDFRDYVL